ncbi:unnamed protein product [Auanema sp. JU1783]|nr:unnamed protein product [Auanema sp. JU1783]
MFLDDVQKSRQLMLKNNNNNARHTNKDQPQCSDSRSVSLVLSLETQGCLTTFVPNNSANGNPIIAVFPRIQPEEEKDPSTNVQINTSNQ